MLRAKNILKKLSREYNFNYDKFFYVEFKNIIVVLCDNKLIFSEIDYKKIIVGRSFGVIIVKNGIGGNVGFDELKILYNKNKEEETIMLFNEAVVKSIEFNQVDEVATNIALEVFARNSKELNIVERDSKFYVVKKGKSKELNIETVKKMIEKALVGIKVADITSKPKLVHLITELNLIKKYELEIEETEIELF